jgi:hypothetical protein
VSEAVGCCLPPVNKMFTVSLFEENEHVAEPSEVRCLVCLARSRDGGVTQFEEEGLLRGDKHMVEGI